jgi:hypothetical protein
MDQEAIMRALNRLICAIRGHEEYLHFDKNRLHVQCIDCGYQSPGWAVDTPRPVLRFRSRPPVKTGFVQTQKVA